VYSGNDAEVEQALKLAQEHYDSSDDQRNLYSSVAWAYFRTGNPNAAIRYTLLAMDTEPEVDFPDLWSMMGHFELGRERFDAAETWYRKALALRSDDINQLFSLARVSLARGETAIALQHMRNAIERLPDFETKDFIAISALYLNGDVAEADSLLLARRSIHVSEPLRWEGMFNNLESSPPGLAWSYLLRSDTARAKNLFDEAETLDMHKRDPAAYTSRGWSQVLEGDFDKAQQTFAAGLEVGYQHGTLRYGMAAIDYLIGEHDRAEQWVKEAIQEGPVHVRMNRFLARIESARGNWKKAQEYAEISVAMDSTRSSQELLSWVLVSGDLDIDRGIEIAQRAQEMPIRFTDIERRLPFRENADHTLGLAYLKKGATRKALNHLRKALADQPNRQFLQDDLQRALELTADAE